MGGAGRPRLIDSDVVIKKLLTFKSYIALPGDKVLSKNNGMWQQISDELKGKKSAKSLHSYVCNNTDFVRDLLNGREKQVKVVHPHIICALTDRAGDTSLESSLNETENIIGTQKVTLSMKMSTFRELAKPKAYKNRNVIKLESGVWQHDISERLWNATKLKCGFNFKYHYLNMDLVTGSVKGTCKCKTSLDITFEGSSENMLLHCLITTRKGTCGKRPLRQPYRTELAESLGHKSAERLRIEVANAKMSPGDSEPPTLPTAGVLNVAKYQHTQSFLLDKDPIVAIAKMKRIGRTEDKFTIHGIGYDPFYVHYWTNHQNVVYKKYAACETASLKIDASGEFVSKLKRPDGNLSQHIFLYLAVINSSAGQFSVTQMLTESQNTGILQNWLVQWIRSGVPPPKETVADASRALHTAIVRTFCGFTTIEKYCDIFFTKELPSCYVRMDVVHFLKVYSTALKVSGASRLVEKFYLAVIGKIILCTDVGSAKTLIKKALIVSMSKTEGVLGDSKTETPCSTAKKYLIDQITGQSPMDDVLEKLEGEQDRDFQDEKSEYHEPSKGQEATEEEPEVNQWSDWVDCVETEVKTKVVEGFLPYAHYSPIFSKHLKADVQHLPMWSCVYRNAFGYGRIPASSAPVEGEINKLKNVDFDMELGKVRVDRFLEEHISIINGKTLLADAKKHEANERLSDLDELADEWFNDSVQLCDSNTFENTTVQKEDSAFEECQPEEQSSTIEKAYPLCPACDNGDEPGGSHTCAACDRCVHALRGCFVTLLDTSEGYGEKRLCIACHDSTAAKAIVAARFEENWRGLGKGSKKQKCRASKYLNNDTHMFDTINFPKNLLIPVMKNGSYANGMAKNGTRTIGVKNTLSTRFCK